MPVQLKPLDQQVVVITGASSGIGLATARLFATRRAKLVLAARSEGALRELSDEINGAGGRAVVVVADVGREEDVRAIARAAAEAYGAVDTWINDAGVGLYGRTEDVSVADMRHLFETNFWGVVYGSLEALKLLKAKGGALINLGSEVSDRAVPLQGAYCASKAAIKNFTDALRMELEDEGAPVSVTLIKPGQIDTPFPSRAKSVLATQPKHVPPVYAPQAVAEAIAHCAEHPVRDVFVGGGAKGTATLGHYAPALLDKAMEKGVIPGTYSGRPAISPERMNLDHPSEDLAERGGYPGRVHETSAYTRAVLNPPLDRLANVRGGLGLLGAGLAAGALLGVARNSAGGHGVHRPVRFLGEEGSTTTKALYVRMEARPGKEGEVESLVFDILGHAEREPATAPWYGLRLSESVYEIFEAFPDEAGRAAHLAGEGAALLMARSNAILARPAEITLLDVLAHKPGEPGL